MVNIHWVDIVSNMRTLHNKHIVSDNDADTPTICGKCLTKSNTFTKCSMYKCEHGYVECFITTPDTSFHNNKIFHMDLCGNCTTDMFQTCHEYNTKVSSRPHNLAKLFLTSLDLTVLPTDMTGHIGSFLVTGCCDICPNSQQRLHYI